ncbi:hypothetical protein GWI33_021749 [Rhynchophorus ferrugineus]|uniref:Uncharacterized protein n=1 Tax=Rhynchophorus ferrugineus TaxID=354439 RepID=A0A834M4Q2_RHYFE|nr:hypothetical protein GWI33_021749 [Rhynchophorus ferrugineus]
MMGFRSLKRVRNASYEIMLEEVQLELGEMREELREYRGELDKVREQYKKNLKRMLTRKKFSSSEEVIAETEAYFEEMDKSYYKNGIEKLEGRYNQCIILEGNYVQ